MKQPGENIEPEEILKQINTAKLNKFIANYAAKNPEFRAAFIAQFNPQKTSENKKDYAAAITGAFTGNALKSGSRYNQWDEYGFDALDVAEDLKPMLDKAGYFIKHKNYEEAILICTTLIETISGEWSPDFDYDGDVQVIYDSAIDKLQEILEQNLLSPAQKKTLFNWYCEEHKNEKHRHVGLNTDLKALEEFFADTPEMLQQSIKNIDERMAMAANDYDRQRAAMDKIRLLQNAGLEHEAETVISQYLAFSDVRKLRVKKLVHEKQYEQAIDLIKDGIKIAGSHNHPGTAADWKDKLLDIYLLQKDKARIISAAEELFYNGRDPMKYYHILKKQTDKEKWAAYLDTLISKHKPRSLFGYPDNILAEIYIEEQYWERLLHLIENAELNGLQTYEKYLQSRFPNEICNILVKKITAYAERNMGRNHYQYVARILKKIRKYPDGDKTVEKLLDEFRVKYKARKAMTEELMGV